jgi:hypothetical protein
MSQNDLVIANQSFPSFRTDLNSALQAINTSQSGTSRPSGAVAGTIWLDTTGTPTSNTLKFFDGTDDISLATINYTANTVDWLDSSVTITGLSTTATGTVLTLSDSSLTSSVNLILQNQKEIRFSETTANGTNYVGFKAPASLSADKIWILPSADGTAGQFLKTDGAGNLSFDSLSFSTPLAVIGNATSGSEIRLPEDTDNGSNYVAIKAPDTLASNLTLTLPSADGTSGQVLQTNGSGVLSFASSGGGILQLKSANEPAKLTTTSSSYTAITNLSVTLTPSSASNKVLILINVNASGINGGNAGGGFAIYRAGSILANANGNAGGSRTRGFAQSISGYSPSSSQEWVIQQGSLIFLDSPATTSSTTYQVYWRAESSNGSILNAGYEDSDSTDRRRHASNITIMEIASTIL